MATALAKYFFGRRIRSLLPEINRETNIAKANAVRDKILIKDSYKHGLLKMLKKMSAICGVE